MIKSTVNLAKRALGQGIFPAEAAWILDTPGRGVILSPETLAKRLPLTSTSQVLEIGPGSGYFSTDVAKRIPNGCLHLLDLQQAMLDKASAKLTAAKLDNFETHLADSAELPFADSKFDVIFMVAVFGEIEQQERFLAEARHVLKHGGILSISEQLPDPDFAKADTIKAKLQKLGFEVTQEFGWPWAYTLNATAI